MVYVGNQNLPSSTRVQVLSSYLREQIRNLTLEVESATEQQILNENEYISDLIQRYTIPLLIPEWQQESTRHTKKEILPHELDSVSAIRLGFGRAHDHPIQLDMLIYTVPCSGNLSFLSMAPGTNMLASLPRIRINDDLISFELVIDTINPKQTGTTFENYKNWIKQHINYINHDLNQYNNSLRTSISNLYHNRKKQVDNISDILKNMGVSMDIIPKGLQPSLPKGSVSAQQNQKNYYSVAISFGVLDSKVATQLNDFLVQNGVNTWFYPEDSVPGAKLHRMMSDMINEADKVILLCSRTSLHRNGVLNELERTLEREAKEGGSAILIPIALDEYVFEEWVPEKRDLADQLRSRNIINWDVKKKNRLLSALIK